MRLFLASFQLFKPKVARSKDGKLQKLVEYFANIGRDYQTVAIETLNGFREHPIKGSFYLSTLAALLSLIKTNPNHRDYLASLLDSSNDLSLIGDSTRNPYSNGHIQVLLSAHKDGRLKYLNLLFFSVMWIDKYNGNMRLYESQCKHLKVGLTDFHKHVVDFGAANRWWWLSRVMEDYDVNPTEWGETVNTVTIGL